MAAPTGRLVSDIDWSQRRGIADETHWNAFVPTAGGELVAPRIKRKGVRNADYMFPDSKVIIEHKLLQTEFAHSKEVLARVDALIAQYPDSLQGEEPPALHRGLLEVLSKPLQRIVNSANQQIKQTKAELGLADWSGILLCVNDGFRAVPPDVVIKIFGHILAKTSYSNTTAFIYLTNHYVELPDTPYATRFWHPLYSHDASPALQEFINDLGRKWRAFEADHGLPMDFSDERENADLGKMSVIDGPKRKTPFFDE